MEPLPDLATLSDHDLKGLIDEYTKEEQEVSYRRRILHGKIDILRAELVARLQKTGGQSVLDQVDVASLTEILAGKAVAAERMSHIYCPECGFQNPEAANYCAKCGALLHERESESVEQTQIVHGRGSRRAARDARRHRRRGAGARRPLGRRPRGRDVHAAGRAHLDRPLARLRHLPRRRHRLAQARGARTAGRPLARRGPGQPQRHLRQPQARRDRGARRRRRAADRQIPPDLSQALMATTAPVRERLLTIGTVCRRLQAEFADISISKIRYLEDQGLLTPKRTQGGYRLFSEEDVDTLETILRLQRDEFLPLRVIREELASGAGKERAAGAQRSARRRKGSISRRSATAPASSPAAHASSRTSDCSSRASRADSASIPRPTSTSPSRATRWRATGSRRATCARSAPRPTASAACSRRSSRRRCARAHPSAAVPGSRTCRRWRSPRTSSPSSSSRATSVDSPVSDRDRPEEPRPRGPGLSRSRASASRTSRRCCSTRRR